jgi:polysaccharide biosynthesis protein PslH
MNVLFLTYGLPYPPDNGARIRDFFFITHTSRHHTVLSLSLCFSPEQLQHLPQLKPYCALADGVVQRSRTPGEHAVGIWSALRAHRPLASHFFFYEELAHKLREVMQTWPVDIIQIEHSFLAFYVDALPDGHTCKKILDFHNVACQQFGRMARLRSGSVRERLAFILKWLMLLSWETEYAQRFDRCLAVAPMDARLLTAKNPALPVSLVENGVDIALYSPLASLPDDDTLLFVGTMAYRPNRDGILYFCREILPLIRRHRPQVRLVVVGDAPPPELKEMAERERILVTGRVQDVRPYYHAARLSIVPLRAGGGTRLKILESMALGRPVVSTSVGCEGLEVVDREHIMIADTPAEFAERVIVLLTDNHMAGSLSRRARHVVQDKYDWPTMGERLLAVYNELRKC